MVLKFVIFLQPVPLPIVYLVSSQIMQCNNIVFHAQLYNAIIIGTCQYIAVTHQVSCQWFYNEEIEPRVGLFHLIKIYSC